MEQVLEWISSWFEPLGIGQAVINTITDVVSGLNVSLFTSLGMFLIGLIIVRLAAKLL